MPVMDTVVRNTHLPSNVPNGLTSRNSSSRCKCVCFRRVSTPRRTTIHLLTGRRLAARCFFRVGACHLIDDVTRKHPLLGVPTVTERVIGLLVPKKLTFPPVLTKRCGVVPDMVYWWHHLIFLSIEFCQTQTGSSFLRWCKCELQENIFFHCFFKKEQISFVIFQEKSGKKSAVHTYTIVFSRKNSRILFLPLTDAW